MTGVLSAWQFTPEITLGLLLFAALYANGMRRRARSRKHRRHRGWRSLSFFAGLSSIYMALQSPLDFLSDHLFFVHQIQHLILMMIAPILLMLSAPEAELIAGLPRMVRQAVLAPTVTNSMVRGIFAFLTHPVTASFLAGGTLYFWMIPHIYDEALRHEGIHYLMHLSMLFTGLLFWWRILDWRRPPAGTPYLFRAGMLKVNFMMLAFLGGYLTSKVTVLYGDDSFTLLDITTLTDERLGGMILWLPGSAILVTAISLMLWRWVQECQQLSQLSPHVIHHERSAVFEGDAQDETY